jgi:invasion protein IalB
MTIWVRWGFRLAVACVAAMGIAGMPAGGALAQQAKEQAKPQSAWVKLCEKAQVRHIKKDGKPEMVEKDMCLTHHERLDGNTGMVVVSAAIRKVADQDEASLMIMVPLGMAIPPGLKAAVYTKDQWERARTQKKVDDKELKPIALKYTLCHPAGCTAEIQVTDALVKSMETGGGLMVLALNAAGQPVAFPVPLVGFKEAHTGKPVDGKQYGLARQKLMESIQERMRAKIANERTGGRLPAPKPVTKN